MFITHMGSVFKGFLGNGPCDIYPEKTQVGLLFLFFLCHCNEIES